MTENLEAKKRLVVLVYMAVFVTIFTTATIVYRNRKIDEALHPETVAPVASR